MIGVTTAIVQDYRIKRKDDTYAIKLQVTFNRMQKYYPLGEKVLDNLVPFNGYFGLPCLAKGIG